MDPLVDLVLDRLFPGEPNARTSIEGLPGPTPRVQIAALKVSGGDFAHLERAVQLARTDWRDLLVSEELAKDLRVMNGESSLVFTVFPSSSATGQCCRKSAIATD